MLLRSTFKSIHLQLNHVKRELHSFPRILDTNSKEAVGKSTRVQGWVHGVRKMKNTLFLDITDGSSCKFLQVVASKSDELDDLKYGCSITAEGELTLAPNGRVELQAKHINIIGSCHLEDGYPFAPRKKYSSDYLRQYLHLRPRTRSFSSILRLRDLATFSISSQLRSKGYLNLHSPILTSNDCEGAGEVFVVQPNSKELLKHMQKENVPADESYFNDKVFLTVSGQFHLEVAARAFTKVYCFGPTFRAENSKSRLHLSEFYMLEAELAFVTKIEEIADEVESIIKLVTTNLIEQGAEDMHSIGVSEPQWLNQPFGHINYDNAIDILKNNSDKFTSPIKYGDAFSKEHELFLVEHNNNIPMFVFDAPKLSKPFYMKENVADASKVMAMDLLAPNVGELIGGGIREDDYEKLKAKLPSAAMLQWYLDLRKYGNVPTGGFGMGFERFLQMILGVTNIKDTIPFPRWPHNCHL